jgi:hypothetical protein
LFSTFGSATPELAEAVVATGPGTSGSVTIVTVASSPLPSVPSAHITVCVPSHVPWLASADTTRSRSGTGTTTTTSGAGSGPAFVTVTVYVMSSSVTTPGLASSDAEMSACGGDSTATSTLAASSLASGSSVAEETEASFEIVPSVVVSTTIVTVACASAASAPSAHVIVSVPRHSPWLAVAETSTTPAGSASLTTTSSAASGPSFVTVRV